jgi:hypothetical protein
MEGEIYTCLFLVLTSFFIVGFATADIIPTERVTDWNPGIPGGIPNYPITQNAVTDHGAAGDGVQDDTAEIQACLNSLNLNEACYLPAGTYRVSGSSIDIPEGRSLKGAGISSTIIRGPQPDNSGIIHLGSGGYSTSTVLVSDAQNDDRIITVSSAAGFSVGDYIRLDETNDDTIVDPDCPAWASPGSSRDNRCKAQITKIAAINGNTLTLDTPIHHSFRTSFSAGITKITMEERSGVEDLKIEATGGGGVGGNIMFSYCAECWAKNVDIDQFRQSGIQIRSSFRVEIRDSYIHDHAGGFSSGLGYGIDIRYQSSECLIENNALYMMRHHILLHTSGMGNVIAYNYAYYARVDGNINTMSQSITTHSGHTAYNLIEGNIADNIDHDLFSDGSSSYDTVFRNYAVGNRPGLTLNRWPILVMTNNRYHTFVGNVIGEAGTSGLYEWDGTQCNSGTYFGYRLDVSGNNCNPASSTHVTDTTYRHQNLVRYTDPDYLDFEPGADSSIPDSLYLDSKPAFFGNRPWPGIGSDLSPLIGELPAKNRFDNIMAGTVYECNDGMDNDWDGLYDYPSDPGCSSSADDDEGGASCSVANDCQNLECNTKNCIANSCVYTNVADGALCTNNGQFCDGTETCQAGTCVNSGNPCPPDSYSCTTESCNEATDSCDITYDQASCDDSNPCTDDTCIGSGGNPITGCQFTNNNNPCPDGFACTTNEICSGGACSVTLNHSYCTDSLPTDCTDGTCTSTGCDYLPQGCGGPSGLVLWLRFDEGMGLSTTDSSGNGNDGTINGATWTTGRMGQALLFNNADEYVRVGTNNINADAGTLAVWALANEFGAYNFIFGHTTTPAYANRIQLYTNDPGGSLDMGLGDQHARATNILDLDTGRWYHIILTWDAPGFEVFVDGVSTISGIYSGLTSISTSADVGNNGNPALAEAWDGIIDDVRIYNRALSPAEITSLYENAFHPADIDEDGCVLMEELLAFIDLWKTPSTDVSMPELMDAIGLWKGGLGCI